ncbi:MAG: AMP-binding protein [Proteobacteria bacterium]|nr:AMP-binding protein [Pseudomonadota bacterium]
MINYVEKFDANRIGMANHAKNIPDRMALIMNDRSFTYLEFDKMTNSLANALINEGIAPGDRVAILMHNSPEIMACWAAVGKVAGTPIALNYRFREDELAYIVNDSESRALIYGEEFEDIVERAKPKLEVPSIIYIRQGGATPTDGTLKLETLIEQAPDNTPDTVTHAHQVASSLVYTSGTTGRPKGVFRNSSNRLNTLLSYAYNFESTYDDVHLVAGPLYHSAPYGWAAFSLMLGNTVVLMPRFDAEEFLRLTEKHKATTTWVVPTMLNRIVNLPDQVKNRYDVSSLRVMTVGGESFPFPLKQKSVEFFGPGRIFEFFGATENSCVTFLRPEDQLRKPGSCGRPAVGQDIRLLDENKQDVEIGQVGVLYTKSPFLLDGYYKKPEATEACYYEGYFTVGDMAYRDEEGYYYIVDRAVDMIISGGVNIYPAEIEETLYHHPAVFDASVIGAKDPDWGEKIVAFIVLKDGVQLTEDEVISHVGSKLASYKKPKEVYFVDELPYSPSGKQLKRQLRQEYEARSRNAS